MKGLTSARKQPFLTVVGVAALTCLFPTVSRSADNEGVTDYAKALPIAQGENEEDADVNKNTNRCSRFFGKYDSFAAVKSLGNAYSVRSNDVIEIKLMQAFIRDFPASAFLKTDPSGSLAIVANVTELSPKGTTSPADFNFSKAATTAGRLVYYSGDVRTRQVLNLSQLPIYGPVTYNGRPLALTLHIFVLHVNSQQINSMLQSLAQVGSLAFPPASPVLSILETLGNTLVTARQEADSVLTYRFMLVPADVQVTGVDAGLLEYGNYVVRRLEDRDRFVGWSELLYNASNGLLYRAASPTDDICYGTLPYKDDTFLSIQVNKASQEVALDSSFALDQLIAQLQAADKADAGAIDGLTAKIKTTLKGEQSTRTALAQISQYCDKKDASATIKSQLNRLIEEIGGALGVNTANGADSDSSTPSATDSSSSGSHGTAGSVSNTSAFTTSQLATLVGRLSQCAGEKAGRVTVSSFDASCVKEYLKLTTATDTCK